MSTSVKPAIGVLRWPGAVVAAVALAACTSTAPSTVTPSVAGPLTAPPIDVSSADPRTDVAAALAAYTNALDAYIAASNTGSDDKTELAKYATGGALALLVAGLADNKAKGLHTQGTPGVDPPKVTHFGPASHPSSVSVVGCVDGTHWLLYTRNGQLADRGPNGRRRTAAQIDKVNGVWKVSSLAIQGVGTCPG